MEKEQKFDLWCIVELMGHNRMAGRCTEQSIAGTSFLRVDVPGTNSTPPFTRFLNHAAIYAINPVTEEVAKHQAEQYNSSPICVWDARSMLEKIKEEAAKTGTALPESSDEPEGFF